VVELPLPAPANTIYDMKYLISYLKLYKCKERVELFSQDESV
jgi:hypothetical protein